MSSSTLPSSSTAPTPTTDDDLRILSSAGFGAHDLGLLLLRVVPAIGLGTHGLDKLSDPVAGSGVFAAMDFPVPETMAVVVGLLEVVVAVMLLAGAATALAASGVVGIMTVAIWRVHAQFGFWFDAGARPDAAAPVPGYEYSLALLLVGVAIAAVGPGRLSLDATTLASRLPAVLRGGTVRAATLATGLGLVGGAIAALTLNA